MFKVQLRMCETCIYRPDSPLDLAKLESEVADPHGGFTTHRICHHSTDVCCRGFWEAHKDEFPMGQVAQRLNFVQFVDVDILKPEASDGHCTRDDGQGLRERGRESGEATGAIDALPGG